MSNIAGELYRVTKIKNEMKCSRKMRSVSRHYYYSCCCYHCCCCCYCCYYYYYYTVLLVLLLLLLFSYYYSALIHYYIRTMLKFKSSESKAHINAEMIMLKRN